MKYRFFRSLDSTNTFCKTHFTSLEHNTVVVSHTQTHGRGQFIRTWESNVGGAYFSIFFKDMPVTILKKNIPIRVARVIQQFLERHGLTARIKKPNDVLVGTKKIAGILCESKTTGNHVAYLIIGVGLNVNQKKFSSDITDTATSMTIETGKPYNVRALIRGLAKEIMRSL